jgi:hypothetical protein
MDYERFFINLQQFLGKNFESFEMTEKERIVTYLENFLYAVKQKMLTSGWLDQTNINIDDLMHNKMFMDNLLQILNTSDKRNYKSLSDAINSSNSFFDKIS